MNVFSQLLQSAGEVFLYAIIIGAGLPTIFAIGVWALSFGSKGADSVETHHPTLVSKLCAGLCFTAVVVGILAGITVIVGNNLGLF